MIIMIFAIYQEIFFSTPLESAFLCPQNVVDGRLDNADVEFPKAQKFICDTPGDLAGISLKVIVFTFDDFNS